MIYETQLSKQIDLETIDSSCMKKVLVIRFNKFQVLATTSNND